MPRLSRIYYNGKFFDYPLKAGNALESLGPWNALRIVLSYLKWHYRPHPVEENFEQWVTNRFGKRLYEIFFKTYTEKVWGMPCTEIRAEWAAQRIQGLSLARAILNAAALNKRSTAIKSLINEFQYPRLGPGQMWEICRDRVEAMGNRVLLQHRVVGLDMSHGRVTAVRADTPAGEARFRGRARHLDDRHPNAGARALARGAAACPQRRRRAALPRFPRGRADPRSREAVPRQLDLHPHAGVKVGRIQNFNNWSAAMVPEPGVTCLGMEYFCFEGDGLWASRDEESDPARVIGVAAARTCPRRPTSSTAASSACRRRIRSTIRSTASTSTSCASFIDSDLRTCTPSAGTACTSTTTRTTRC